VILADEHARDNVGDIELALGTDGKFLGVRLHMLANLGAYVGSDRQLLTPFGQIVTPDGRLQHSRRARDDRRSAVEYQPDGALPWRG
jgi:hypothetical protein